MEWPATKLKREATAGLCAYRPVAATRLLEFRFNFGELSNEPGAYQGLMRRMSRDRKQPGIGEAAFWTRPGYVGGNPDLVVFARGCCILRLSLNGIPKAKAEARMKALARKAIKRLPA